MTRRLIEFALALGCVLALPLAAVAQSSISGTAKDPSGGLLAGVKVEVSSPALIEGGKTATTDGSGQFRIIDLRPGMYSVKFTLVGFQTLERPAFQLLSDFNARIDVEMKVGAMEEMITVTAVAPIVDVQSAAHVAVLDRDAIDNIPTGKTLQGIGQLILGVSLNAPDVGGSAGAMQTYMSLHVNAVSAANNTIMVDGMVINGLMLDGAVQTYTNDADFQEMTYQTASIGADRSGGGVAVNLIPREGGNRFSGSGSGVFRPGNLQGDNYSERFQVWGLPRDKNGDPAINRVDRISDLNIALGGPIERDKLWLFASARDFQPINTVPNTFLDEGTVGLDVNYIRNALVRLTYQLSPQQKLSAYYERVFKWRGYDMGAFDDPETAAITWTSPNYSTASAKYTWTLTSRLLVDGGFSQNVEYYRNLMRPGIEQERGTAAWYASARQSATGGGAIGAPIGTVSHFPMSQVWQASVSYVTGSHHAKTGLSMRTGRFSHDNGGNADLVQTYPTFARAANYDLYFPTSTLPAVQFAELFPSLNGVRPCAQGSGATPSASTCNVTIRAAPRFSQQSVNADLGLYVQDSFTMKRLTINAGLRYETLNAQVDESLSEAGRFIPAQLQPERKNLPDWKDWAPRFQLVYDVFGNSRTAVKYSFNRYNESVTTSTAAAFDGNYTSGIVPTSARNWTDLNGDNIVQGQRNFDANGNLLADCTYLTPGCEINLSGLTGITQTALTSTFGRLGEPGVYLGAPRRYRLEQGIEVQHELLPRVSVTGTYYRGENKNVTKTVNLNRTDNGTLNTQYRAVTLFNPIDGTPFVYYNAIATIAANNVTDVEPLIKRAYDSYTAELRMRPYPGAQLSGGISFDRRIDADCGTSFKKADGSPALVDPNTLRFCDEAKLTTFVGTKVGKPYTKDFKLSGVFPLIYGINFGVSYQNIDSGILAPSFRYGANFRYPDGTSTYTGLGGSYVLPACPTTYGCGPGGVTSTTNLSAGAAGNLIGNQFPYLIAEERIVQLDIKLSKNLRFGRVSVQPSFEAFNLNNIDQVRSRISSEYNVTNSNYLIPNNMLQGRIVGFGVDLKW